MTKLQALEQVNRGLVYAGLEVMDEVYDKTSRKLDVALVALIATGSFQKCYTNYGVCSSHYSGMWYTDLEAALKFWNKAEKMLKERRTLYSQVEIWECDELENGECTDWKLTDSYKVRGF